jgi:putative hemolysin
MSSRTPLLILAVALLGCPSKDSSSSSGATSPSGAPSAGTGPLASLESAPALNETWTTQEGQALPFLFYAQQNVRISAQCRQPNGQLACDAIRQLRNGAPVALTSRDLNGGMSAGTKACIKLGQRLLTVHNAMNAEDGICAFPDGSMVSTGALEQYGIHVGQ